MLKDFLNKLGLSDKEIAIYLAGLKLGKPTSATEIAKKAGVNRQNAYDILEKLRIKGLVSVSGNRYNTRFFMEGIDGINGLIDRNEKEIQKTRKKLDLVLPELSAYFPKSENMPKVRFYDGQKNIEVLFSDILNSGAKEILAIMPTKDLLEILGRDFAREFVRSKAKKGIITRTIRIKSKEPLDEPYFFEHEEQLRQVRYAPANIKLESTLAVFADKVIFVSSTREDFIFLIESEEYALMIKTMFEAYWNASSVELIGK